MTKRSKKPPLEWQVTVHTRPIITKAGLSRYAAKQYAERMALKYPNTKISRIELNKELS